MCQICREHTPSQSSRSRTGMWFQNNERTGLVQTVLVTHKHGLYFTEVEKPSKKHQSQHSWVGTNRGFDMYALKKCMDTKLNVNRLSQRQTTTTSAVANLWRHIWQVLECQVDAPQPPFQPIMPRVSLQTTPTALCDLMKKCQKSVLIPPFCTSRSCHIQQQRRVGALNSTMAQWN